MSKTHKFALVGTSCVGKTTILSLLNESLSKTGKKTIMVKEAARLYFSSQKINSPFSFFHQTRIQNLAKKQEEIAHRKNPDIIISDRSVIDAVVYVRAMKDRINSDKLYQKSASWLPTYTYFFLLDPLHVPYKTDEIRVEQKNIRELFHKEFLSFFSKTNLPFSLISDKTIDKRTKSIMKIAKGYL